MKGALLKNTLRSIWRTRSRYISILLIVALGVGFFAGVKASCPDMMASTDEYSDRQELMHFRLVSTWGFDSGDVEALSAVPGARVKPSFFVDSVVSIGDSRSESRLIAYYPGSDINRLWLKDGRFPENVDECVLDSAAVTAVGEKITVSTPGAAEQLENDTFTVVGHVYTSMYISDFEHGNTTVGDGGIDMIMFIPAENFPDGVNTEVYLVFDDMKKAAVYTDGYNDLQKSKKDYLEALGKTLAVGRYERTVSEANEAVREGEEKIRDGKSGIADAEAELTDAEKQLSDGKKLLDEAAETLASEQEKYEKSKEEYEAAEAEYDIKSAQAAEASGALIAARRDYAQGYEEYTAAALQAEKELSEAKLQIAVAEERLSAGKKELDNARTLYDAAEYVYNEARSAYDDILGRYEKAMSDAGLSEAAAVLRERLDVAGELLESVSGRLDSARSELEAREAEYASYVSGLDSAKKEYESARSEADRNLAVAEYRLTEAKKQIEENEELLLEGAKQLSEGRQTLDEAAQLLRDGEKALSDGRRELAGRTEEYEKGLAEYNDGLEKLREAKDEIAAAEEELSAQKKKLAGLSVPEWYVFTRDDNGGYAEYGENAQRVGNIAKVFPAFFILVAALVCMTGMTRMVNEERTQIGTMKALGYSSAAIIGKYLLYCLSAAFAGCVLGLAVGFKVFPFVISKAYSIMYRVMVSSFPFIWRDAAVITLVSLALTSLVVVLCCLKVMLPMPAVLMRAEAPKAGKRVFLERVRFIWSRLSFFRKVTIRNVFRYRKRMIMTLIGIMGCTALMLCGFGLRDSIADIVSKQFDNVMLYKCSVYAEEITPEDRDAVSDILRSYDPSGRNTALMQRSFTVSAGSRSRTASMMVLESAESTEGMIDFKSRVGNERYELKPGEVIISEKLSSVLGAGIGDKIDVHVSETSKIPVRIGGVAENYIQHYIFMLPETYAAISSEEIRFNTLLLSYDLPESEENEMAEIILARDNILGVMLQSYVRSTFARMMEALNAVVLVLLISAVLLAVIVLYNLASINIAERSREIATLEVLGFNDAEVSKYIFRESIALSVIGSALGLALGKVLADFVIRTAEIDLVMFGREIHLPSYLLAMALTILFSLAVNLYMTRYVRRISMVESLKSVD